MSLSGAVPRERSFLGRGCQDPAREWGNTQTLWSEAAALVSSLSYAWALHRPTPHLSAAALPAPCLAHLPSPLLLQRLHVLISHIPFLLLPTSSRLLRGTTWREWQSGAPPSTEAGMQGSWSSTRGGERAAACPWGSFQCLPLCFLCSFLLPSSLWACALPRFYWHSIPMLSVGEMEKEPLPEFVSRGNLAHALWPRAWCGPPLGAVPPGLCLPHTAVIGLITGQGEPPGVTV